MAQNLVIYSGAPFSFENSIKKYGFHKLSKKKFSIKYVESAEIFHEKKIVNRFRKISKKSDRFRPDIKLKNFGEFEKFFKNICKKTIILIINRGPMSLPSTKRNFDITIFNSFGLRYVFFDSLHWSIGCNFRKTFLLNLLKFFWNSLIKFLIKINNKDLNPYLYVGSGNMFLKDMGVKRNYINCSSNYIEFEKSKKKKKKFIIYIDEGVDFARDVILYNSPFIKNHDNKKFLKDLHKLFHFLEKKYKQKVVIAASNKYQYPSNFFGKRKIIYGKTSELIDNAKLILGHSSSALYQSLISNSPVINLKHKKFGLIRKIFIDLFASNVLNQKSIFIENIIKKKKIKLNTDKKFRYKILKNYFISENLAYKNFNFYLKKGLEKII